MSLGAGTWPHVGAAIACLFLAGAVAMDLRSRRVPNRYWIGPLAAAIALPLAAFLVDDVSPDPLAYGFAAGLTVFLYAIWWFGLFGGADAKGLMAVAWLVPVTPSQPGTLFALDAITTGALLSLLWPVGLFVRNVAAGRPGGLRAWIGWPMAIEVARERHVWPLEKVDPEDPTRVRPCRMPRIKDDVTPIYDELEAAGHSHVWVGPKIPFMVPLFFGALAVWAWGNPVLRVLERL